MYRSEHHWDDYSSSFQWWSDTVRLESESPCCSISDCSDSMTSKMLLPSTPLPRQLLLHPLRHQSHPAPPFFAEVDVCHSNPCANGATCVENADSYKCLCLPSYGGDRCEIGTRSASANVTNQQQPLKNNRSDKDAKETVIAGSLHHSRAAFRRTNGRKRF